MPSARAGAERARWCLLVLVVEVRARVTAPAKFISGAADSRSWLSKMGGRSNPGSAQAAPKIVSAGESAMTQGTVKWFSADRGYGFIAPDDGTPDLFVHHSAVKADDYRDLRENQRVEFTVGHGAKGPRAEEVRPL
jgi:CspA family cold shock protein